MIALPEQKAALAFLERVSVALHHDDPHVILAATGDAIAFYKRLQPETPDEYEAIRYGVDAIAAAQVRALCLLELERGDT